MTVTRDAVRLYDGYTGYCAAAVYHAAMILAKAVDAEVLYRSLHMN